MAFLSIAQWPTFFGCPLFLSISKEEQDQFTGTVAKPFISDMPRECLQVAYFLKYGHVQVKKVFSIHWALHRVQYIEGCNSVEVCVKGFSCVHSLRLSVRINRVFHDFCRSREICGDKSG